MKGIFLNVDINTVTFPFLKTVCQKSCVTEEDLYPFIDQYKETEITDVSVCVFNQISMTPSQAWSDVLDVYHRKTENGVAVDYTAIMDHYHQMYEVHGIDPHEVWFRRCREVGITSWLSVRMNDCHCPDDVAVWIRGEEFYLSRDNGWNIGDAYGYQRYCFDYSQKEIRKRMLAYIEEQVTRYDTDGLELDFSREWYCFREPNTSLARDIMTGFVRDVKAILKKAELRWGHPLLLHLRAMRGIEENCAFGFDIPQMVNEGLLDSISVAPRWASNDSDMPIDKWKERFPSLPVYAGVTDLTLLAPTDAACASGYAAAYLALGADKIYLYNFFSNPYAPDPKHERLYRTAGSLQTLVGTDRRIVVTYQDMHAEGLPTFVPLPARANGYALSVPTGPFGAEETVSLVLGFDREIAPNEVTLKVDGIPAAFVGKTAYSDAYAKGKNRTAGCDVVKATYLFALAAPPKVSVPRVTLTADDEALSLSYLEFVIGASPEVTEAEGELL